MPKFWCKFAIHKSSVYSYQDKKFWLLQTAPVCSDPCNLHAGLIFCLMLVYGFHFKLCIVRFSGRENFFHHGIFFFLFFLKFNFWCWVCSHGFLALYLIVSFIFYSLDKSSLDDLIHICCQGFIVGVWKLEWLGKLCIFENLNHKCCYSVRDVSLVWSLSMVLQKRLDYGFNGYQVPHMPRATRSARVTYSLLSCDARCSNYVFP